MSSLKEDPGFESRLSVLVVEDDSGDGPSFQDQLRRSRQSAELRHLASLDQSLSALGEMEVDVVVLDLELTPGREVNAIQQIEEVYSSVPVVALTGGEISVIGSELRKAGASDCLRKEDLSPALAAKTVRWAVRERELQKKSRGPNCLGTIYC